MDMTAKLTPKHIAANARARVYAVELERINQILTTAGVPLRDADGYEVSLEQTSIRVYWLIHAQRLGLRLLPFAVTAGATRSCPRGR